MIGVEESSSNLATAKTGAHIAICAKNVGEVRVLHAQEVSRDNVKNRIKERGVTLVALVVTVIVLLILAGVTITAITGDNGIIKQAQESAEATKKAQIVEKVEMAVLQSFGKDGDIDKDKLIDNLKDVDGIDPSTIPSDSDFDFPLNIIVDDHDVVIEENGDVHIKGEDDGNTNTTPGGNTSTGGENNTSGETNTSGDTNTSGNNSTEDTNTTNEIEIPDADVVGVIEVSGPTWSNGTASITISKGAGVDSSLSMQHKKADQGDDQYVTVNGNSETISGLTDGDVIIVRLTDGKGNYGGIKTINIEDAITPIVVVNQGNVGNNNISVTVNATDNESGMPSSITYKYYIKKSTDGSYPGTPTATNNSNSYTFNTLEPNTSYDIKVEADDIAGNIGTGELRGVKTTITIPDANVEGVLNIDGPNWNEDGTASVIITKGDNVDDSLDIEYKKEGDSDYTKLNDGEIIDNLQDGDKIYIHLTDGTIDGTDKVIEIKDTTMPTVTVNKGIVTENSIEVTVNATDSESGIPSPTTYNYYIKKNTDADYPTQPTATNSSNNYTFNSLNNNTSYDIKVEVVDRAGNTGSDELKGIKTLITIPNINDDGVLDIDGPNWNGDGTANITITKGDNVDDNLYVEYKKEGDDEYTPLGDGETIEGLAEGDKIYIHITDGDRNSEDKEIEIKDEISPTVTVTQGATSTNGITVNVDVHDGEGGMPDTPIYNYYIKPSTQSDYPSAPTVTDTNASHTFDDLEQGISYDIKVEVVDKAGNTGTGTLTSISTGTIPSGETQGNIIWGNINWNQTNGTASVTVSKGSGIDNSLELQYQIVANNGTPTEGAYRPIANGGIIPDIANGSTVYARLWDGNNGGNPASLKVEDTTAPIITVTLGTVTETSISVSATATDSQSGMPSPITYNYYIKKSSDDSYPSKAANTNTTGSYTFENLDDNERYDIAITTTDNVGNAGVEEATEVHTLITIPDANDGSSIKVDGPNWNGDGTADITITKGDDIDDSLEIEYKKEGDDNYTKLGDGETIDDLQEGDRIYIHLTDGDRDGGDIVIEIKDEAPPIVNVSQGSTSTNGITVNVNASDGETGMPAAPTYYYYIKNADDQDYPSTPTATDTTASYTFGGLEQGVSYDIKVEVADNAGNTGTGYLTGITTDTIPDPGEGQTASIVWGNIKWDPSVGTANVTVSKGYGVSDSLQIQYQVVANSETQPVEELYKPISNGASIPNLTSGNVVYARLWDGNNAGSPASINVEDSTLPTVTVIPGTATENSIPVTVNAIDSQSGIPSQATYKYYIKKSTDETYQIEPNATEANSTYTFTNLGDNTKYDIKVEVADRAGKTGIGEAKEIQTLITIPDANEEGIINVSDPQWSNGTANVTVTKGENVDGSLYIEYKREGDDDYTRLEDGETIDDLQVGDKIYIHLTDGTRDGTDKEVEIKDTNPPTAQIKLSATTTDTNGSITATVTQTDNESGININQTKYVYNTTATEIGTNDISYTGGTFNKTQQDIILNSTVAGTYYLHVLSVDNAGNKKETISGAVTVSAIAEKLTPDDIADNPDEYYGDYVDYQPSNGETDVKWKIFYAGTNLNDSNDTTNRIYLIADDYISSGYAPNGKGNSAIYVNDTYKLSFNNIINAYSGSSDIGNSLAKTWLSFLNSSYGSNSTYANMKAVAYMMDTDVWSGFKDSAGKAEYAIGGPTLDLFSASYNQKYTETPIEYQPSTYGYQVRWQGGSYANYIYGLPTNDSLYVIGSNNEASAMWLASPSVYGSDNVMISHYQGYIDSNSYDNANNRFPTINLPKT